MDAGCYCIKNYIVNNTNVIMVYNITSMIIKHVVKRICNSQFYHEIPCLKGGKSWSNEFV